MSETLPAPLTGLESRRDLRLRRSTSGRDDPGTVGCRRHPHRPDRRQHRRQPLADQR